MSPELAAALAAYAVALDGNILEGVWSIGGPLPEDPLTGALLGTGQGLSYSHNNYEGDASIGRNDAYLNNGDAHSLNITKFEKVYAVGGPEDRYTMYVCTTANSYSIASTANLFIVTSSDRASPRRSRNPSPTTPTTSRVPSPPSSSYLLRTTSSSTS